MNQTLHQTETPTTRNRPMLNTCIRTTAIAILFAAGCVAVSQYSSAQANLVPTQEQRVKCAYLYNFVRYVQWPDAAFNSDDAPFVIGILAEDPHGPTLDRIAAKKRARGRQIVIRRISTSDDLDGCHLVFIFTARGSVPEADAIRRTERKPILLICDSVPAPTPGAPIRFFADPDGTVGLRINVDAMERRGLKADAKLLRIASVIRG